MRSIAQGIEKAITVIGKLSAWSMALLLIAIVSQVILRYLFGITNTMLEDSLWYLFAMTLVLGMGYTLTEDGHVRVDFLYQRYSDKTKTLIDICGIVFFLIPLYTFLMIEGWDFAAKSFRIGESSPNPGGMPALWFVKGLLPFSCFLLLTESIARIILLATEEKHKEPTQRYGS